MKTRLITAAVGIIICLAFLCFYNQIPVQIAISVVSGILCFEYLNAKKLHKKYVVFIPCIAYAVSSPLFCDYLYSQISFFVFTIVFFVLVVLFYKTVNMENVIFAYGGTVFIAFSMTAFADVSCNRFGFTPFWVVLTLAVPWLADSGAYFAGVFLGKHKLCPDISPKKTVEGAIGGIICGALGAVLVGYIFSLIYKADMSVGGGDVIVTVEYLPLIIIGLINPVLSIFGDLTFSLIKRYCGIKDFGSIMPGHGGLLDRFDSVLFCIPLIYIIREFTEIIYIGS